MAENQQDQGNEGNQGTEGNSHVPYARFQEVVNARNSLAAELKTLQDAVNAWATERDTLTRTLSERENALEASQRGLLRARVAALKNIPFALSDRLVGDTQEDLERDADALAMFLKPAAPQSPGVPPPPGGSAPQPLDISRMTPEEIRKARADGRLKLV